MLKIEQIKRIAVVGAGTMGHGIAQVMAQAGLGVSLTDSLPEALASARGRIESSIAMLLENGLIGEAQAVSAKKNLSFAGTLDEAVSGADLIFEVIPEKVEVKRQMFARLDQLSKPETIFASNTSAIPITTLAGFSRSPERVIGTHFWNPPQLIPLVEVVTTGCTAPRVLDSVMQCLTAAGKKPVHVSKDVPGFIGNRLQHAMMREAMHIVEEGVASVEGVDAALKNSFALRLLFSGAFEQRDLNGLDTQLGSELTIFPDLCDVKEPPPLLRDKVARGELGLKAGKGYYDWSGKDRAEVVRRKNQQLVKLLKFLQSDD
ncbi:MAG: 3-hydroxyacyl-CoA dehydrogenase NAD-binding domain-containing protein [Candidatus Korobacteraceae bacterium]|jgi:3-hydroxybutyryl-CoA dehydrogenase